MRDFFPVSRAGLFLLLLVGFLRPLALEAAPIVLQATTLSSDGCGAEVSGVNFDFNGVFTTLGNGCGGRIVSVGIGDWPLPGQASYYNPVVTGAVTGTGFPARLAVAYGGGQPSLFKDVTPVYVPDNFSGTIAVNVVLSGTLQVCLEPANVQTPGQVVACDPEYANFALIDIDVAGQALFQAFDGNLLVRGFEGFTGTSAAAPEPSQLGAMGGTAMLLWVVIGRNRRQRAGRGPLFGGRCSRN